MKNKVLIAVISILLILNLGLIYSILLKPNDSNSEPIACACDASRFKSEYEALNGQLKSNGVDKHLTISIPSENPIEYVDYTRVKQILTNGTGVIYFGFPECPWCRNLIPTLIDVANEKNVEKIYYLNNLSERDKKKLDENKKIITEKEGSTQYYELLDILKEHIPVYEGLENESIKRLYFPTVVFVKDGDIVGFHQGTVDSQEDASVTMSVEQQKELKSILRKYIEKTYDSRCSVSDENC